MMGFVIGWSLMNQMSEIQEMEPRNGSNREMLDIVAPEWFARLIDGPPGRLDDLFSPPRRRKPVKPVPEHINPEEELVVCRRCKEEKPRSEFYKHSNYSNGLNPQCKECLRGARGHCEVSDGLTWSERLVHKDLDEQGLQPKRINGGSGFPDFATLDGFCEAKAITITVSQFRELPKLGNLKIALVPVVQGSREPAGRIVYVDGAEFFRAESPCSSSECLEE